MLDLRFAYDTKGLISFKRLTIEIGLINKLIRLIRPLAFKGKGYREVFKTSKNSLEKSSTYFSCFENINMWYRNLSCGEKNTRQGGGTSLNCEKVKEWNLRK